MPVRAAAHAPRLRFLFLALLAAAALASGCAGMGKAGPSAQALELRAAGDLIPHEPPQAVLAAYFTAGEETPRAVYGPVSAYAKSRACAATWLMERGELARVERLSAVKDAPPFEFSLTLEEDCPGRVTHSVFVAAPGRTPEAWLKWRSQFHGRKAEAHYAGAMAGLKAATQAGFAPGAELRFVSVGGDLVLGDLDARLKAEGRLAPVFDLTGGR